MLGKVKDLKEFAEDQFEQIGEEIEKFQGKTAMDTTIRDVDGITCSWAPLDQHRFTGFKSHIFFSKGESAYLLPGPLNALLVSIFPAVALLLVIGVLLEGAAAEAVIVLLIVCLIFFSIGAFLTYQMALPVCIKKSRGVAWKGFFEPENSHEDYGKRHASIDSVIAIQTLQKRDGIELNMVLTETSRVNILDNADCDYIKNLADKTASFLAIPHVSNIDTIKKR